MLLKQFPKMEFTVMSVALLGIISCVLAFDVPEPVFEVFHPKGIRVSIPDSDGVQSVQFLLSLKSQNNEDGLELFDDPDRSEDGRWSYWNPEAVLQKDDQIYYKVTVEYDDLYWNKEGEYVVDNVFSLDGGAFRPGKPKLFGFGGMQNGNIFRNRHRGLVSEGKKSTYHSSYSSYQSSDSKPITRSSTSSATGTYLMKPNGEVEASGYKKSEVFDSTKREGEQWEMSESEMTAEELDELKRFIGPTFTSFSDLTAGQVEEFKRLHGSNFHLPERLRGNFPGQVHPSGTHSYEESYFSKESSSRNQGHGSDYFRQPSFHQYHGRQSAHESTTGRLKPVYTPAVAPETRPTSSNHYEEHRYNHQSTSTVSQPVALSHISNNDDDDDDYQKPVPVALPSSSRQSSRNYDFSRGESHHVVNSQSPPRSVVQTNPSPSYLAEEHHSENVVTRQENIGGGEQTVEKPKYQIESHYKGSIFKSITSSRVNNPQECSVWAETNYDHVTDLREIQKNISKMSCLANLAENSLKEELKLMKQQNQDLYRKLESLDRDFRKYQISCRCSG